MCAGLMKSSLNEDVEDQLRPESDEEERAIYDGMGVPKERQTGALDKHDFGFDFDVRGLFDTSSVFCKARKQRSSGR